MRFRPLTAEASAPTTLNTAADVSEANVVRAFNVGTGVVLVTVVDADGATVGSMSVAPKDQVFIDKARSHKVYAGSADIKITSVTYPI